ncbi:MAG: MliC family protein [Proteobacteria bacterium]|nr:MliC family protein [Pseudomonadota bacterium]
MMLSLLILALDVLKPGQGPSFDCSQSVAPVPQMICTDPVLAGMDRDMAALYAAALGPDVSGAAAQRRQGAWQTGRDACGGKADQRTCLIRAYQQRITELKILAGQLPVFASAQYACEGTAAGLVSASYFQGTPPAVLIEYQGERVVAFAAESGSGARYTADAVQLWEHQGIAALRWRGQNLRCPKQ